MNPSTETSVADDQLADFIDRILRMKEEADAIAADIRDVYAEAKANGFDKTQLGNVVTYLRKKDKDAAKLEEGEAVFDLYLGSYLATKNRAPRVRAYARARAGNGLEITEPAATMAAEAVTAHEPVVTSPVESGAAEISTPIQPETANETAPSSEGHEGQEEQKSIPACEGGTEDSSSPLHRSSFGAGAQLPQSVQAKPEISRPAGEHPQAGKPVEASAAPVANITTLTQKPLRPYCLNPGNACGGMGKKHCWKCQKAHDEEQGAA